MLIQFTTEVVRFIRSRLKARSQQRTWNETSGKIERCSRKTIDWVVRDQCNSTWLPH